MDLQQLLPILIPLVGFALAVLLGKPWIIVVPGIIWLIFFSGLEAGWWGYGYQEGWLAALLAWTSVGAAVVLLGLDLHGRLKVRRQPGRKKLGDTADP